MESDLHNVIKKGDVLKDIHKRFVMYQTASRRTLRTAHHIDCRFVPEGVPPDFWKPYNRKSRSLAVLVTSCDSRCVPHYIYFVFLLCKLPVDLQSPHIHRLLVSPPPHESCESCLLLRVSDVLHFKTFVPNSIPPLLLLFWGYTTQQRADFLEMFTYFYKYIGPKSK